MFSLPGRVPPPAGSLRAIPKPGILCAALLLTFLQENPEHPTASLPINPQQRAGAGACLGIGVVWPPAPTGQQRL